MSARPLRDEADMVLDYIRKNTQGTGEWVSIGSRDMPKLFNISQIYFLKLVEPIKEHPNVIYEVDEHFASRFKPYRFRWADDPQEKLDIGLTSKQFYWLTDEEVEYVKKVINLSEYSPLSKLIKIVNLLAGDGGKQWWIPVSSRYMSDLADMTKATLKETKQRFKLLLDNNLLVKAKMSDYYHLVLDPNSLQRILEESRHTVVRVKPKLERKKRKPELHLVESSPQPAFKAENIETVENVKIVENVEKINNAENNVEVMTKVLDKGPKTGVQLIQQEALGNFAGVHAQEKTGIATSLDIDGAIQDAEKIEHVINSALSKSREHIGLLHYLKDNQVDTQRSYEAFIKLREEYEALASKHRDAEEKLREHQLKVKQYQHENKLLCEYNESFLVNAQARLDVLLGIISGYLDEYVLRPKYEKTNEVINSRLKINIWDAVKASTKEIVNYKPEDKFPPNLR